MQRVLITGGSGFVGYHLIEQCLLRQMEVFVAIRKTSDISHLKNFNVQYTFPDFTDISALQKELEEKQYDFIIHAAGSTKARTVQEYNNVNAEYTSNLAAAISQDGNKIKKFVFMSSLGAIGPSNDYQQNITPATTPSPVTAYGKSKLMAEEKLASCKVPLVILRPTAVYGPREKDILIILKTIAGGFEPYIGRVPQQLSFIYVKDLAELTVNALFSEMSGAYNITDGNCYNRYQLGEITKKILNKKTIKFHIPYTVVKGLAVLLENGYGFFNKTAVINKEKLNELTAINWCCDIDKARTEQAFSPKYNLESGLKETLDWYMANRWL